MKTDKEKLKKLLKDFGVGFKEDSSDIYCEAGDAKINGYAGFSTWFEFDKEGRFVEMGAYE